MALFTSAIIGTLSGGLTSILPGILDVFNRRAELKHETEMAKIQSQLGATKSKQQISVIDIRADAIEGKSLRRHDSSLDGEGFIGGLRASVRPVITYCFFVVFVGVEFITIWVAIQNGTTDLGELKMLLWDADTVSLFGAVIGFWFGSRTIEKLKRIR